MIFISNYFSQNIAIYDILPYFYKNQSGML